MLIPLQWQSRRRADLGIRKLSPIPACGHYRDEQHDVSGSEPSPDSHPMKRWLADVRGTIRTPLLLGPPRKKSVKICSAYSSQGRSLNRIGQDVNAVAEWSGAVCALCRYDVWCVDCGRTFGNSVLLRCADGNARVGKVRMQKLVVFLALLLAVTLTPPVVAWNALGHRGVAEIAWREIFARRATNNCRHIAAPSTVRRGLCWQKARRRAGGRPVGSGSLDIPGGRLLARHCSWRSLRSTHVALHQRPDLR